MNSVRTGLGDYLEYLYWAQGARVNDAKYLLINSAWVRYKGVASSVCGIGGQSPAWECDEKFSQSVWHRFYQKSFLMRCHVHVCLPDLLSDQRGRGWQCELSADQKNHSCQMDPSQLLTLAKIRDGTTNISSSSLAKNENWWYLLTLEAFPSHLLLDLLTFSRSDRSMRLYHFKFLHITK